MKKIVAALASVSLLAAPMALGPTPAMAQHSHGSGGSGHGSFAGAGRSGWHGGSFHNGGFYRGGNFRGGFRGGYGRGFPFAGAAFGLFFGAAIADSWYYDYPAYYGYYGPYGGPYPDDYYGAPPPPDAYDDGGPPPQYQSSPEGAAQPGQACGSWSWNPAQSKYDWVPC
jgi:hypothetical protein